MPASPSPARAQFVALLQRPEGLPNLPPEEQDTLVRIARHHGLLGRLALQLETQERLTACAPHLRAQMLGARTIAAEHRRLVLWEVNRILRATHDLGGELILLKGAAYYLREDPWSIGRAVSDVDILVPEEHLPAVEKALKEHGWKEAELEEYDQRYYRQWMHELPPLRHQHRGTDVDVHHTILPRTSRRRPDPQALIAAAVKLDTPRLATLAPTDMVLHNIAHLFQDGDFQAGLRQLVDLDGMLRAFSRQQGFWRQLKGRAMEMDLVRPLYYGLVCTREILKTPLPDGLPRELAHAGVRATPMRWFTQRLMVAVLTPVSPEENSRWRELAAWLLYIRSHWLRMPPTLLFRHLRTKAARRQTADR